MLNIPAGTFEMGSTNATIDSSGAGSPISVTLGAFTISQTFITQAQYQAVLGSNPSFIKNGGAWPVEQVSWYDAVLFCNALSKQAGLDTIYNYASDGSIDANVVIDYTKNGYRLPTEAEYEYACRAGLLTDYYWGTNYPPVTTADTLTIDSNAVWWHNSPQATQPAASKKANTWGLYDMCGNVLEWCNDWFGSYATTSQINPTGSVNGSYRVLRGGSCYSNFASNMCSAYRFQSNPASSSNVDGFRVVRGAR
jgi:formylglycine-generating enzyme required for sulfatase activity